MKRLSLLFLAAAFVLVGCAGDNPSGPSGGTLDVVTGLTIDESGSSGDQVVLNWTAVSDVDGYYVYWRANNEGSWSQVGDVTGTTYTHTANSAGGYAVMAYKGDDTSSDYSNVVDCMPNIVTGSYTIYDNYAPAEDPSGFIFHDTYGETGMASSGSFDQDIYAYDPWTDADRLALYSGDYGPFGNGEPTMMIGYGDQGCDLYGKAPDGSAGWWDNGEIYQGDVIFCQLFDDYYTKMYINTIAPDGVSAHGTYVTFTFEFQPINGLRLFTTNS